MTAPRIPTPAEWTIEIMGAIGQGHKDRAGLLGRLVDHGYHYFHVEPAINAVLADMVARGQIEAVQIPSHYDPKQTWTAWRLPASAPFEAPAVGKEAVATRPGFITPEQYRAQAKRGRK